MINLTVFQTGDVSGDKGKIVGYVGQAYSEIIHITHPIFSGSDDANGVEYFLEYKYNSTIYRDKLDSYDRVRLKIENNGYMKCSFIAIDIVTGNILFKSEPWNFIVKNNTKLEPSHYPCDSFIKGPMPHPHMIHNHSNYPIFNYNSNNDFNAYEAYHKLMTALQNEEDIRYNEIAELKEDIVLIKAALNISKPKPSIIDANEIILEGKYFANNKSINFPEANNAYILDVTKYSTSVVIQTAYEVDGDNSWFRTGAISNGIVTWTSWAQNITRVAEI